MKLWLRLTAALICAVLMWICCACSGADGEELETIDPNWTTVATTKRQEIADPEGLSDATFVRSTELGDNMELTVWLAESLERIQTRYTMICSQDADSALWHCWFYAEGGRATDTLAFSKDANETELYLIRYTQSNAETDEDGNLPDAEGVWYFTLTAESLPQFEVLKNGETSGVLVTYADRSVAR